jgi:hypothetical protein
MKKKIMNYTGDSAMRRRGLFYVVLLLVFALLCVSSSFAGDDTRTGTAGATELLIPVGARSVALSGSTIASSSGADAIFWNPAGMSRLEGTDVLFNSMSYIADIKVNYFAIATNFGGTGTVGLSLKTLNFGDIPITTTALPEGTGGSYSPSYITFALSYSNKFTDRIFGGFTVKYVSEKIVETSASGIAVDFGIQYLSSIGLKLGVVLKNLGPQMTFGGQDGEYYITLPGQISGSAQRALSLTKAGFELPSTLEFGVGYDITLSDNYGIVSLNGAFQNSNFGDDEFRGGVEYGWDNTVFLRAGVMRTQNQSNNIYGPTFGFGVNIPLGGTTVTFDYSYRQTEFFNGNQWIGVKLAL